MYIGVGAIVLIVVIVLLLMLFRGRATCFLGALVHR